MLSFIYFLELHNMTSEWRWLWDENWENFEIGLEVLHEKFKIFAGKLEGNLYIGPPEVLKKVSHQNLYFHHEIFGSLSNLKLNDSDLVT